MNTQKQGTVPETDVRKDSGAAADELSIARERFNIICRDTSVTVWDYDIQKRRLSLSESAIALHGFDGFMENVPDSLIESGFVHPESARAFKEMYERLSSGEEFVEGVFRIKTTDGKGYWHEYIRYHVLFNEQGKPYVAVGISANVTDEIEIKRRIEREQLMRRQQLLADTLQGGMMGSYVAPNCSIYFIDEKLLHWLGYDSEEEYINAVGGMVDNGIHPDDRENANKAIAQQLAAGNRYEVDYRMRRKDGGYIWVRNTGEKTVAQDGREATISVCQDISKEKEHDSLLNNMMSGLEASVALYRVEQNTVLTLLHASRGIMNTLHYTDEEYWALCKDDAMDFVYVQDRDAVKKAIEKTMQENTVATEHFRMYNKKGGTTWTSTLFSRCGMDNGRPVLRVIFMPISIQSELQLQMLDSKYISVYAIDEETDELYFANSTALKMYGKEELGIAGKACYDAFFGGKSPCRNCWKHLLREGGTTVWQNNDRFFNIEVQKKIWNNRNILIVYCRDITEETELKNALQLEEERYRTVVEQSKLALMDYDVEHGRVYQNELFRQYASSREKLHEYYDLNQAFSTVHPEDIPKLEKFYADLAASSMAVTTPIRLLMVDGTYQWSELHGLEIKGKTGAVVRKLCFVRNIDDTVKQYQDLKARYDYEMEKQNYFEDDTIEKILIDITDDRVLQVTNAQGNALERLVGISLEKMLEVRLSHTTDEQERQKLSEIMNRENLLQAYTHLLSPELEMKANIPGKMGKRWFRTNIQLIKNPENEHVIAFFVTRNIDRKKMEETLLYRLLETNYTSVSLFYAETGSLRLGYTRGDAGFISDVDISFDDVMRATVQQYVTPTEWKRIWNEVKLSEVKKSLQHNTQVSGRALITRGKEKVFKVWTAAYFDSDRELILFTVADATDAYKRDLENNLKLTAALEKAEKASLAKNDFLSRMSHDMRTPMNAILGMTHLAADCTEKGTEAAGYLEQINQSSQFLLGVINDILEVGHIESGKVILNRSWYSAYELFVPVIQMIEPLMKKKEIHFEYNPAILRKTNREMYDDVQKFQQLFMNLLNNACKFTPEGGTVRLLFKNVSYDKATNSGVEHIIVQDTGCGMSKEFLERIFQPFEQERLPGTENIPGTGLGLSIAYSIAKAMGGDILVESELGKGSTFTLVHPFTLRVMPGQAETEEKAALQASFDTLAGYSVLLAEDNEINATIAIKLLKNKGMQVQLAHNGQEAVQLFTRSPVGTFDLILMDIRMPVMDGLEATRCIRGLDRPDARLIPIIAMSANAFEEDRQLSIKTGMTDHLAKPVEPEKLYRTILTYARKKDGSTHE